MKAISASALADRLYPQMQPGKPEAQYDPVKAGWWNGSRITNCSGLRRPVYCSTSADGTKNRREFPSCAEAERRTGAYGVHVAIKERFRAGGLYWFYVEGKS